MKNALIIALLFCSGLKAQTIQDKINKANYDLYKANQTVQGSINSINSTSTNLDNSVKSVKEVGSTVLGWISSHKKDEQVKNEVKSNNAVKPQNEAVQQASISNISAEKTILTINNCNFELLRSISSCLATNDQLVGMDKSFSNNTAILTITHNGTPDALLEYLETKLPGRLNVLTFQTGAITMAVK